MNVSNLLEILRIGAPNDLRLSCGAQAEAAASYKISFPRRPKRFWAPAAPSAC